MMAAINWARGFRRVWYFLLGLIWLVIGGIAATEGPANFGEVSVYLLVFTLGWLLLGGAILWVARGFRKEPQQSSSR